MRILWTPLHPTLARFDVPALLSTGHEIIPLPLKHDAAKYFCVPQDRAGDIPVDWRKSTTLAAGELEKILEVDLYNISATAGPGGLRPLGRVSESEAELLNKHFDAIVVASYPNAIAEVLRWFKGVVVFRHYGNQNPDFKLLNWWLESFPTSGMSELYHQRSRYLCNPILHGLLETEGALFLGENPTVVGPLSDPSEGGALQWSAEGSEPWVATNVSYLHENTSWLHEYNLFKSEFAALPYRVFGRNDLARLPFKDARIEAQIDSDQRYFGKLCEARVLCVVGRHKSHTQYTPIEGLYLGIPTLFHEASGFSFELKRCFGADELRALGMCTDYQEMAKRAKSLLSDKQMAIDLAVQQRRLKDEGPFNTRTLNRQAGELCNEIARRLPYTQAPRAIQSPPKKKPVLYWVFIHETLRAEEVPLLQQAGFGVIPARMVDLHKEYHGAHYDDEQHATYPRGWRESVGLPRDVIELIQKINLISSDNFRTIGTLSSPEIKLLNEFVDCIVLPAHVPTALNLIASGYNGVVLLRYFGHYVPGWTRTKETKEWQYDYSPLADYPNYWWMPGLTALTEIEDPIIARDGNLNLMFAPRSLERSENCWKGESSKPHLLTVISSADLHLKHYYENFKEYFSELPHSILGKNDRTKLGDPSVVGKIASNEEYLEHFLNARAYVEVGFVPQHCHYTPLEALQLGVPVLFERRSGFFRECAEVLGDEHLFQIGGCHSFDELRSLAQRCLDDVNFAIELANQQKVLLQRVFNRERAEVQARAIFERVQAFMEQSETFVPVIEGVRVRQQAEKRSPMQSLTSQESGQSFGRNIFLDKAVRFFPRKAKKLKSFLKKARQKLLGT
jgi:hypothetical protein